jgi:cytochrome d ubiquinol oxidase subunit II
MGTLFFCFVAFLLAGYAVLDGYDLGTGILHVPIARDDAERRQLLATIAPLWDGNEVFLIAAGGTLFFAFPALYAATFSGFYLPLMIVLWLLIIRGVSIDLRSHLEARPWRELFDAAFFLSSGLLAFFLGVALGNVVRGVPIGADRIFIQPLWTEIFTGGTPGVIDWYSALVGATALVVLAEQGALWIVLRTDGPVRQRAHRVAGPLWLGALALVAATSVATFFVQPRIPQAIAAGPWRAVFPALGAVAAGVALVFHGLGRPGLAFGAWSALIALLVATAAFGLYPWVLPSTLDPTLSLVIDDVKAADSSLRIGAIWWPFGVGLAVAYSAWVHWKFSGRVAR